MSAALDVHLDDRLGRIALGTVIGIVRLAGDAEIPRYPQNPVQVEGRAAIPDDCTPPREADDPDGERDAGEQDRPVPEREIAGEPETREQHQAQRLVPAAVGHKRQQVDAKEASRAEQFTDRGDGEQDLEHASNVVGRV